jgi:hypothetical protein
MLAMLAMRAAATPALTARRHAPFPLRGHFAPINWMHTMTAAPATQATAPVRGHIWPLEKHAPCRSTCLEMDLSGHVILIRKGRSYASVLTTVTHAGRRRVAARGSVPMPATDTFALVRLGRAVILFMPPASRESVVRTAEDQGQLASRMTRAVKNDYESSVGPGS